MKGFRDRLQELGYIEGHNISLESRFFDAKFDRLPALAAELVSLNCDVIVTEGSGPAVAAKNATKTIPIVMAWGGDAVRLRVVADLAQPGGNVTGLTSIQAEERYLWTKFLKEESRLTCQLSSRSNLIL